MKPYYQDDLVTPAERKDLREQIARTMLNRHYAQPISDKWWEHLLPRLSDDLWAEVDALLPLFYAFAIQHSSPRSKDIA